jgi:hypothetical protein
MTENSFSNETLTEEEAFWVMFYFLEGHYKLSDGQFDISDILSASQPFEFDKRGHFDGQVHENRSTAPADSGMIWHWNEAVKKFRAQGKPSPKPLTK